MSKVHRSYITVVAWPPAMTEAMRIDSLTAMLGIDRVRSRGLARRQVPAILARDERDHAERVALELRTMGVAAVAVPGPALAEHMNPTLIRSIERLDDGGLQLTFSKGNPEVLDPRRLLCLVRGHARSADGIQGKDFGVGALHQLQGTLSARDWDQGHSARARVAMVEVLDLHTIDGPHWRMVGGHCRIDHSWGRFGGHEADTPRELLDAVAETLAKRPGAGSVAAKVDREFDHAQFLVEFTPDFGIAGDWRSLRGFSLYSAWVRHWTMAMLTR